MKKVVSIVAVLLVVACFACVLTACEKDDGTLKVSSYEIKETVVNIGDKHGTPTITAHMSDGTDKTVSNNLVYDKDDVDALKLDDDGKYTKAGSYSVKVYILEQQDQFYLGEWKITVKVTK